MMPYGKKKIIKSLSELAVYTATHTHTQTHTHENTHTCTNTNFNLHDNTIYLDP